MASDDLVRRLRWNSDDEAADAIERLERELAEARKDTERAQAKLERFCTEVDYRVSKCETWQGVSTPSYTAMPPFGVKRLRSALRAALADAATTEEPLCTPDEWASLEGVRVIDPDGWRVDGKSYSEPISKPEWARRMLISTIGPLTPGGEESDGE